MMPYWLWHSVYPYLTVAFCLSTGATFFVYITLESESSVMLLLSFECTSRCWKLIPPNFANKI